MKTVQLPILPLRNSVLFPQVVIPLAVGRRRSVRLVQESLAAETPIAILTQQEADTNEPTESDLYRFGCSATILKVIKVAEDNYSVIVQGQQRIRLLRILEEEPFLKGEFQTIEEPRERDVEIEALFRNLKTTAKQVVRYIPEMPKEATTLVEGVTEPGQLADFVAANLDIPVEEKQHILESLDLKQRLRQTLTQMARQLEVLKVSDKIQSQIKEEIDRNQREYYLRQQLKAIKEQLGEIDGEGSDLDELAATIEKKNLPEEVVKVAQTQLSRLRSMQPASSEYSVTRNYLDTLLDVPWLDITQDKLNIFDARQILDEDHYDLDKVKKRILEYLAVRKLKNDMKGPILCLVGPPGVGKTSLGKSIARALDRKFVRISLGGVHDEAEIRGHRRTYVGALPGRIIQGLRKAKTSNPVFMLDEIDKLGRDFRGDPSAALLEVLDPEQNNSFSDHYLEIPIDLSRVLFITTANVTDTVSPALKDRMEVIELPGYTFREKEQIALQYLLPKQLEEHGITTDHLEIQQPALQSIIDRYTREAGVRNLERRLADICRGVAVKVAETMSASEQPEAVSASAENPGSKQTESVVALLPPTQVTPPHPQTAVGATASSPASTTLSATSASVPESEETPAKPAPPFTKIVVDLDNLHEYLGPERFIYEVAERTRVPGVATGLAWTATGGDILFIESTKMPGKGELLLTGQLGDVMKESARAALSFIRSRTAEFAIEDNFLKEIDLHLHIPAGAIPKDGPSAGITLFTSLLSLLSGIKVRDDVAMTGEITLRGNILPVGGVKEKILAAHRAGIHRVILPERNRKDMVDVSEEVKSQMELIFVSNMSELPELVLESLPGTADNASLSADANQDSQP
ncbi:MAG: endopeptidase La [Bradymonadales bacterium]|nr:endopeptidase La [Bradymonadales bacterium]